MAQQNLTLRIDVTAQEAATKVQQITKAFNDLGIKFTTADVKVKELGASATNCNKSVGSLASGANETGRAFLNMGHQAAVTGKQLLGVNLATNAITAGFRFLISQWRHALDINLELTAAQRLLNAATQDGGAAFDWVKHKAYEYGLAVSQLAQNYGVYIASAKDSTMSLKDQNYVFESMIQTVSALGMRTEEADRIFYALREILAKNQLTSQELVRQWGNSLPGAVNRAIKAYGQGADAFKKALHAGAIRGEVLNKWLVEYARLLREDFEQASRQGAESLQGSLMKMRDAVELLYLEIGKGDGFSKLNESIRSIADELRKPGALLAMRELGNGIATAAQAAKWLIELMWEWRSVLIAVGKGMAAIKIAGW